MKGLAAAALLTLFSSNVRSAPPPGIAINPELHAWFERQHNLNNGWCCNLADGHILEEEEWRVVGNNYEVFIRNQWVKIDSELLRRDPLSDPNPTGKAIVWYAILGENRLQIYCFASGTKS